MEPWHAMTRKDTTVETFPLTDAAASCPWVDPKDDIGEGARIGEYLVEERRAQGGHATIYRARHVAEDRLVALKLLHPHLASTGALRRFLHEAQTVSRIRHPHIVEVYDFGHLDEVRPYLVMEWLDGLNLDEVLVERHRFGVEETLGILAPLCSALSAAHQEGVVHRDLKASNVMLVPGSKDGTVKLLDFGIAKLLDPDDPSAIQTTSQARLGTPNCMSPEQILGQPIDPRTDIYALGVLIFQLVTGRLPFVGSSALEVQEMQLHVPPPAPSELVPGVACLDALVKRCLAKDKESRYPDVEELYERLRRAATQPSSSETSHGLGLGVLVEIRCSADLDEVDDAVLMYQTTLLAEAKDFLSAHGFWPVVEATSTLLVVMPLPDGAEARQVAAREAVLAAAALASRLRGHIDLPSELGVSVAMHAAPVVAKTRQGVTDFVGGDLLCLAEWPRVDSQEEPVFLSPSVLALRAP
jgi:serine/threonine-protein kinase